jgi:uncharacterized membrane protein YdjX (TVP38/TMEM64 family)
MYFFHPTFFQGQLGHVTGVSLYLGYFIFLLVGSLRGFTLIPSTYLIIAGLLFFQPVPLFILVMVGIIISSVSVYYFSEFLHFDTFFEKHHLKRVTQIRNLLEKNELPIIILWSFAPVLPTDIICYVCGTLRVNVKKFILGICIGEGTIVGIYIFFGGYLLKYSYTLFSLFS